MEVGVIEAGKGHLCPATCSAPGDSRLVTPNQTPEEIKERQRVGLGTKSSRERMPCMQMSQAHLCIPGDDRTLAEVSHIDGSKLWGLVGQGVLDSLPRPESMEDLSSRVLHRT